MTIQAAISTIQTALVQVFPTLEAMGIAKKYMSQPEREVYFGIYRGAQKIEPVIPDTSKQHICFFYIENMKIEPPQNTSKATISLYWWGQLHRIDPMRDYDFTENVIARFSDILHRYGGTNIQVFFDTESWKNFSSEKQMYMLPFSYFRIQYTQSFQSCI